MLKYIINLKFLPCNLYRRWYLNKLKEQIESEKYLFLCNCNHSFFFIKFYDLEEVRANNMSEYLKPRTRIYFFPITVQGSWFVEKFDRINFLEECIKINKSL